MKQPLMLTQSGLPPAQAEALYEAVNDTTSLSRSLAGDAAAWPGEDWEDDESIVFPPRIPHAFSPASFPPPHLRSSARR